MKKFVKLTLAVALLFIGASAANAFLAGFLRSKIKNGNSCYCCNNHSNHS